LCHFLREGTRNNLLATKEGRQINWLGGGKGLKRRKGPKNLGGEILTEAFTSRGPGLIMEVTEAVAEGLANFTIFKSLSIDSIENEFRR
jgi:hypothetical protein